MGQVYFFYFSTLFLSISPISHDPISHGLLRSLTIPYSEISSKIAPIYWETMKLRLTIILDDTAEEQPETIGAGHVSLAELESMSLYYHLIVNRKQLEEEFPS